MHLRLSYLLALVFISYALWEHTEGHFLEEVSTERMRPAIFYRSGDVSHVTVKVSLQSLSERAQLGPLSKFRYFNDNVHKSAKGVKHVRLIQTFGGYDVMGSSVVAELNGQERFSGHLYGDVVKNLHKYIPDPEACQHNVKTLLDLAIRLQGLNPNDPHIRNQDGRRIIFASPESTKAALAYRIQFFYKKNHIILYPVYIFDACSHNVLMTYDDLKTMMPMSNSTTSKHVSPKRKVNTTSSLKFVKSVASCDVNAPGVGGNEKVGKRTYNVSPLCLAVKVSGSTCKMEGTYGKAIDNEQSDSETKTEIIEYTCGDGYSDEINGGFGIANDAFFFGEIFGEMFQDKYSVKILNYEPRIVVHYDKDLENAYSDGTDTYYGDGGDTFYPLVGLDIVSHEIAHAITSKNSNLVYSGMSGGMNEAFSDISAVTTRGFFTDPSTVGWTIGGDIYKGAGAIRYMDDPTKDGSSIKWVWRYRFRMGVHTSSGVFNHAFYTLVATNGMDMFEAYKCFLDANLKLWKPMTNFFSGACGVVQAAYDNGYDHSKVRRSFRSVGIPLIFCQASALSSSIYIGETREEILVSASRSPILKLELNQSASNATLVEVVANDKSKVKLVVAKDDEVSKLLAIGDNVVKFDTAKTRVYVKLMSNSRVDVPVKLHVKAI